MQFCDGCLVIRYSNLAPTSRFKIFRNAYAYGFQYTCWDLIKGQISPPVKQCHLVYVSPVNYSDMSLGALSLHMKLKVTYLNTPLQRSEF